MTMDDSIQYWHELTFEEQQQYIGERINEIFKQPDWCMYPDALHGTLGCWALTCMSDKVISKKEDCCLKLKCDLCKK